MVNFITRFFARLSTPSNKLPKRKTITTAEAAKQLNRTIKSVNNLVYRGRIEAVKVGREWAIFADALDLASAPPTKKKPTPRRRVIDEIKPLLFDGANFDEIARHLNALGFSGQRGGNFYGGSVAVIIRRSPTLRSILRKKP